jgi:hypothetical protein
MRQHSRRLAERRPGAERDGILTEAMCNRFRTLAQYGAATGASGILFTCSAFGEAIAAAAAQLPIPC